MALRERSTWPLVLLVGFAAAVVVGGAVAAAGTTAEGRPFADSSGSQRVTGTVVSVDTVEDSIILEGLVAYDPPRAGIGTLAIEVDDLTGVAPAETVDVVVRRVDGRWVADELVVLDPD